MATNINASSILLPHSGLLLFCQPANLGNDQAIMDRQAHGWSPHEIHFQHPHLLMAQIHSALAYYFENQAEIDVWIQRDVEEADRLAAQLFDPEFRERLIEVRTLPSRADAGESG